MSRYRKNRLCRCTKPLVVAVFGAALLCLCLLSVKIMLVIVALTLIALGIWLLKCP